MVYIMQYNGISPSYTIICDQNLKELSGLLASTPQLRVQVVQLQQLFVVCLTCAAFRATQFLYFRFNRLFLLLSDLFFLNRFVLKHPKPSYRLNSVQVFAWRGDGFARLPSWRFSAK